MILCRNAFPCEVLPVWILFLNKVGIFQHFWFEIPSLCFYVPWWLAALYVGLLLGKNNNNKPAHDCWDEDIYWICQVQTADASYRFAFVHGTRAVEFVQYKEERWLQQDITLSIHISASECCMKINSPTLCFSLTHTDTVHESVMHAERITVYLYVCVAFSIFA